MNTIKRFFKNEFSSLFSSVSKTEYALWWLLRIGMVAALIYKYITLGPGFSITVLLIALNLLASFTIFLIRLLLFPKRIFGKLPYRCQTHINVIIFFASFLGHGFNFVHEVTSWDKFMHFLAGAFALFIGNELIGMFVRKDAPISDGFRTFASTGFSYIAIVIWEIYEFIIDYNWPESNNMAYNLDPERDPFFLWLYGGPSVNFDAGLFSLFDTLTDMICAVGGTVPAIFFLLWQLKRARKKTAEAVNMKEKEAVTI